VQSANNAAASGTSITVSLSGVTSGNSLVLSVNSAAAVTSVSDTKGNVYANDVGSGAASYGYVTIRRSSGVVGGSVTVTVNFGSSVASEVTLTEVSGTVTLDVGTAAIATGTTTAQPGAITTAQADDIVFTSLCYFETGGTVVAPGTWTGLDTGTGATGDAAYKIFSSTQSNLNPSWALSSPGNYACAIAAYTYGTAMVVPAQFVGSADNPMPQPRRRSIASQAQAASDPAYTIGVPATSIGQAWDPGPQPMTRQTRLSAARLHCSQDQREFAFVTDVVDQLAALNPQQDRPALRPVNVNRAGDTVSPPNVPFPDLQGIAPVLVQQADTLRRRATIADAQTMDVVARWYLLPLIPSQGNEPNPQARRQLVRPEGATVSGSPPPADDSGIAGAWHVDPMLPAWRRPLARFQPPESQLTFWSDTSFGATPDGDDAGMSAYPQPRLRRIVGTGETVSVPMGSAPGYLFTVDVQQADVIRRRPLPREGETVQPLAAFLADLTYVFRSGQTAEPRQTRARAQQIGDQAAPPLATSVDVGAGFYLSQEVAIVKPPLRRVQPGEQVQQPGTAGWADLGYALQAAMFVAPEMPRPTLRPLPRPFETSKSEWFDGLIVGNFVGREDPMPRRIVQRRVDTDAPMPFGPSGRAEESVWFGNTSQDIVPLPRRRAWEPAQGFTFEVAPPIAASVAPPTSVHGPTTGYVVLVGQMYCAGAIVGVLEEGAS
jgi:hypothetical protein